MKRYLIPFLVSVSFLVLGVSACDRKPTPSQKKHKSTGMPALPLAPDEGGKDSMSAEDYAVDKLSEGQALMNELRFRNWTEEQWINNDYAKALRDTLNRYDNVNGDESMEPIPYAKNRIMILNGEPTELGGIIFDFVFEEHYDKVYMAWVFSHCVEAEAMWEEALMESMEAYAKDSTADVVLPSELVAQKLSKQKDLHWDCEVRAIVERAEVNPEQLQEGIQNMQSEFTYLKWQ